VKHSLQLVLVAVVSCFVGSLAGPAIYESVARAQPAIVVPERPVGHYQLDAYGYSGGRGCILDTIDGQLWHVDREAAPQLIGSVRKN
jgi:hypothetical protein